MKYNKISLIFRTMFMICLAGIFGLSACTDNSLSTKGEKSGPTDAASVSPIDGNPIVEITSEDFYSGQSEYLHHVTKTLAHNGLAVLKAFHTSELNQRSSVNGSQSQNHLSAPEIPLNKLIASSGHGQTSSANTTSGTSSDLSKMSGQINIKYADGSVGGYYLYLTPHSPPSHGNSTLKGVVPTSAATNNTSRNTLYSA